MKKVFLTLLAGLCCLAASAFDIKGLVVDENGQPLSYACVYVKSAPDIGTVTDNDGNFTLSIDYNKYYNDTLIVSYIGYRESHNSIYNLKSWAEQSGPSAVLKFRLHGEPIQISEAKITEKKGKKKNSEIVNLLRLVSQKLEQDFPREVRSYKIKADSYIRSGEKVMGVEQDVGVVTERPDTSFPVKVKFKTTVHKVDVDPGIGQYLKNMRSEYESGKASGNTASSSKSGTSAEEYLEKLGADELDSKDVKEAARKAANEETIERHVQRFDSYDIVRGIGNMWPSWFLLMFDNFAEDSGDWTVNKLSDNEYLLQFYDLRRFVGIIKIEHGATLRINVKDYSVKSYYQNLKVHANIPFGYKLSDKELEILNGVTGMDMKKFKLKKLDLKVDHNAFFVRKDGKLVPTEKLYDAVGYAYDRKNNGVDINAAVKMNVLEAL